jgi:hypothetical protein
MPVSKFFFCVNMPASKFLSAEIIFFCKGYDTGNFVCTDCTLDDEQHRTREIKIQNWEAADKDQHFLDDEQLLAGGFLLIFWDLDIFHNRSLSYSLSFDERPLLFSARRKLGRHWTFLP